MLGKEDLHVPGDQGINSVELINAMILSGLDKKEIELPLNEEEYENKLRVKGEFDEWAERKMLENQKSQLKDLEQSITDFEKTGGKKEWYNNVGVNTPMLEADKWEMGEKEFEKTIQEARDFIKEKRQIVEDAEKQLQGAK